MAIKRPFNNGITNKTTTAHADGTGQFAKKNTGKTWSGTGSDIPGIDGDKTPGSTTTTTTTSPYDDYLKAISSAGNYDDGYWTKISNQLLANNRYGLNKADAHEKYYTDLVESYKSQNPLETDWGKAILSQYGIDGDNAANAEYADAASSNGGNIDSYAEANARRQKLSYINSGINAVNDASNQRFSNMLGALEKMGVNTANLFGIASKNGQSAMGAAQDRYAQDTNSTIAYNEMLQNVAPYMLGSSGDAVSSMTVSDRTDILKQLQSAYNSGGETGLMNTMDILLATYGNDSSVESLLRQYFDAIVGGGTSGSSGGDSGTSSEMMPFYSPTQFMQVVNGGSIYDLPTIVRKKLESDADKLGVTPIKYAEGIIKGTYDMPSWMK